MANYPTSAPSFTTKANTQVIDASHVNSLQDEVTAIGTVLVNSLNVAANVITSVKFPGTQVASTDANTLDDYEEGTWTPALKFGGAAVGMTYALQTGRYTKIGRLVVLECSITLTAKGSSTGAPTITGMPFNAGVTGGTGVVDAATGVSALTAGLYVVCDNAGILYLFGNGINGRLALTEAGFSNAATFTFSFQYFV